MHFYMLFEHTCYEMCFKRLQSCLIMNHSSRATYGGGGGGWGIFTCLKDQYTLIEQSDLDTLIEQSQYSSEEQCCKLINKEIWLVVGEGQLLSLSACNDLFLGLPLTARLKL